MTILNQAKRAFLKFFALKQKTHAMFQEGSEMMAKILGGAWRYKVEVGRQTFVVDGDRTKAYLAQLTSRGEKILAQVPGDEKSNGKKKK